MPPEICNIIYRYSLVEDGNIDITPSLRRPGPLCTCTQIRTEATLLWYDANELFMQFWNCDTRLLRAFLRTHPDGEYSIWLISNWGFNLPLPLGVSCWDNLEAHCRVIHAGTISPTPTADEQAASASGGPCTDEYAVIRCAQKIAAAGNRWKMPWDACQEQLKELRHVAGHADPIWRQ